MKKLSLQPGIILILVLFSLIPGPFPVSALAQEQKPEGISGTRDTASEQEAPGGHQALEALGKYLEEAALSSPELESAFNRWKAALEKVPQAEALPDPRFNFGYFVRPIETRTGPQRARIGISQAFPWFGKRELRGDVAFQEANAQKAQVDYVKSALFYEIKDAYYEYAYLGKAIEITRQGMKLLHYLENVIRSKYSFGDTPYGDVLRTQVELGKTEDRVRSLEDLRRPVAARLLAAMNRPAGDTLPWPPDVPVMEISLRDEEILKRFLDSNPQIRRSAFLENREQSENRLARKEFYPDIILGLETIAIDTALNPATPDSGEDPVIASISINIPLWLEKRRAAVRQSEALGLSSEMDTQALKQRLHARIQLALYKYRDAQRKIDLYRNTLIPRAEQTLGVTIEAFQAGTRSSLDLIDAERVLLELDLSYIRALADQAQRFAEIEMLVGEEIPCTVHGSLSPGPLVPRR